MISTLAAAATIKSEPFLTHVELECVTRVFPPRFLSSCVLPHSPRSHRSLASITRTARQTTFQSFTPPNFPAPRGRSGARSTLSDEGWEDGEAEIGTGGKSNARKPSLPKESDGHPAAEIISTFHQRQQTAKRKSQGPAPAAQSFKTNETLCISRVDPGPAQTHHVHRRPPRTFRLWHQLSVKQNWVIALFSFSLPPLRLDGPVLRLPLLRKPHK